MINFHPDNNKHFGCDCFFWPFIYYHGVLETMASKARARSADIIMADTLLNAMPDGIHAGKFADGQTVEPCLAFIFTDSSGRRAGLCVHIADIKAMKEAYTSFEARVLTF